MRPPGSGHTRWATHGRVSFENAHPLTGCADDEVAVVLNGIVENFRELRDSLIADGHEFTSETDAEVVAHLVERHYTGDLVEAVRVTYDELEGHFAFVVAHRAHPGMLVGARLQCPLVVGVGDGEMFLASSIAAFLRETRRVKLIEDGEVVAITSTACASIPPTAGPPATATSWRSTGTTRPRRSRATRRSCSRRSTSSRRPSPTRSASACAATGSTSRTSASPRSEIQNLRRMVDPRLRHGVPRRRRRPLRHRGVGAHPLRAGHRERVGLPQPGARQGHARRRHLAVRRDARHDPGRPARARGRGADARDHQPDGHPDHARGRTASSTRAPGWRRASRRRRPSRRR